MRAASDRSDRRGSIAPEYESPRLSVIVADGMPRYLETVRNVLDFHDTLDLVGRAGKFDETIQICGDSSTGLGLMDIEMLSADGGNRSHNHH
jgi:DNA-binding NarL/FixJ family response regulator